MFRPGRCALATETLTLLQRWLAEPRLVSSRLVLLTQDAAGPTVEDVAGGAIWGLVRTAQSEYPGRFVLADVQPDFADWPALAAAAATEHQLAVRDAAVLAPRVVRRPASTTEHSTLPAGTVLVTGGTGGLGAVVAEQLITKHGASRLLLVSRRGPAAPGAEALAERLRGLGAEVDVRACDVADRAQLQALLAGVPDLIGVVHSAGVLADATIERLTPAQLESVFAAKVTAGWLLHELTAELPLPLALFTMFSSVAGVLGNPGQANYAAANVTLDGLAGYRRQLGLAGVSIAWGLWSDEASMAGSLTEAELARLARSGVAALDREQGLALFDYALKCGAVAGTDPVLVAARWETGALTARAENGSLPSILRGLVRAPRRAAAAGSATAAGQPEWFRADRPAGRAGRAGRPPAAHRTGLRTRRRSVGACQHRRGGRRPVVQRAGLRLADRGGDAQPAGRRHRAAVAGHAGLRPPHRGRAGRLPVPELGTGRAERRGDAAGQPGQGRSAARRRRQQPRPTAGHPAQHGGALEFRRLVGRRAGRIPSTPLPRTWKQPPTRRSSPSSTANCKHHRTR